MLTLKLIFLLAVLGWSLYSVIVYYSRRSDNKAAMRSARNDAPPVRSLTEDEAAALAPFLFEPAKPDRPMPLHREGVFVLQGEYVRHGLHTSQGGETMHDTIGGVEVILPHDARDFLEPLNRAEVVFTEKLAVVVTLNDSFDLIGGRTRALRRQQQDQQWQTGKVGELPDVEPAEAFAPDGSSADEVRRLLRVEMLGQRDETPAEASGRMGNGRVWLAAIAWFLAFQGLLATSFVDASSRWMWGVPSLLLVAFALWMTWGPRRPPAAGKVNRVRGHVAAIAVARPGGGVGPVRWFVGDKFPVELPDHWKARWTTPPDGPVDVEMRVADHTAVRFGKALSIDEEVTRFRPVRWGRHLLLASAGAVGLAGVLLWADGLSNDLVLTGAWLRGAPALAADSPQALHAGAPAVGTPVHLTGRAACHWTAPDHGRASVDCTTLRWVVPGTSSVPVQIDPLTVALHEGTFLRSRNHTSLALMMQLQLQLAGRGTDPLSRYQAVANAPRLVSGVGDLVRTVNTACTDPSAHCDRLRELLAEGLLVDGDDAPKTWAAWTQRAASGQLAGDNDVAVMRSSVASSVQSAGRGVAEQRAAARIAEAMVARQAAVPETVLLSIAAGPDSRLPQAPEEMDMLRFIDTMNHDGADGSGEPFDVSGLLVARGTTAEGVPVWHVDASRGLADPWSPVIRVGALALALLLLLGHGAAFITRLVQGRHRRRAVDAFIDQRMPAAGFGA